jgi:hypothetical protein
LYQKKHNARDDNQVEELKEPEEECEASNKDDWQISTNTVMGWKSNGRSQGGMVEPTPIHGWLLLLV